ncbi:MAG: hypothetical protein QOG50_579, partial [Actinomycetota bacterium]|nr:hypothetical protein [Actinomycetota bacterium]
MRKSLWVLVTALFAVAVMSSSAMA